jgi:hypothetical protein
VLGFKQALVITRWREYKRGESLSWNTGGLTGTIYA